VAPEDENDSEDDGRTKEAGEEGGGAAKDAKGTTAANDPVSGSWTVTISMNGNPLPFPMSMDLVLQPDGTVTGEASMMDQTFPVQNARFDRQTKKLSMEAMGPGGQGQQIEVTIGDNAFEAAMSRDDMSIALTGTREAPAAKTQGDSGAGGGRRGGGKPEAKEEEFEMPPASLAMPFGEYGFTAPPEQETVLLTNATIWTSGPRGIIRGGAMLVRGGKIEGLYDSAPPVTGVTVIDVEGRHITPGLIDCHSHTAISGGVNEGGQTNTGECRIRDVVNPDDINIYRQLAGGLTAMNQLHGSANPIGGQNCVVKLKWGASAEEMIVDNYKPGIKFALGENVTRGGSRYPGSRMGVETFIRDAFTAGREWSQRRAEYAALGREEQARSMPVRRDLELEAMAEIVAGNRIIHCHSYRQDEILMLMRVCESFAVRIGTFQHVLEGFKVADAIAAHGAGASSFADWWAYKVEVMDAIPHNGSLMTQIGVNVSFNSDDSELARRMNTEAAKAVRYGGLEPAEALKLVTINPATQIGIGHRTGSLEPGKDADFVVWSGDPLSTYSRAEQTWIEGRRYFDRLRDAQMRAAVESERHRIIQKLLRKSQGKAPASQAPPESADGPKLTAEARHRMEEMVRYGFDPLEPRCGECGDEHDHFRP